MQNSRTWGWSSSSICGLGVDYSLGNLRLFYAYLVIGFLLSAMKSHGLDHTGIPEMTWILHA